MIIALSENPIFVKTLKSLFAGPDFCCFGYVKKLSEFENLIPVIEKSKEIIDAIIIDSDGMRKRASEICDFMKENFPQIKVCAIVKKRPYEDALFRYIKGSDFELIHPLTTQMLRDFISKVTKSDSFCCPLKIDFDRKSTSLLGYKLSLSKCEHRILLLLYTYKDRAFTKKEIANLCLFSGEKEKSVPVLICKLNKKSSAISNRRIALYSSGNGYYLNKEL